MGYDIDIMHKSVCSVRGTVTPAKSDSDVMSCLQSHQGLIIDRSLVYYINSQVIYGSALVPVECTS